MRLKSTVPFRVCSMDSMANELQRRKGEASVGSDARSVTYGGSMAEETYLWRLYTTRKKVICSEVQRMFRLNVFGRAESMHTDA